MSISNTKSGLVTSLPKEIQVLIARASEVRKLAYAPYSNYLVGSALIDAEGRMFAGCNVENASYSAAICAERVAISKMISEGGKSIRQLVVLTSSTQPIFPCGVCRQVITEFGADAEIYAVDGAVQKYELSTVADLFPHRFTENELRG